MHALIGPEALLHQQGTPLPHHCLPHCSRLQLVHRPMTCVAHHNVCQGASASQRPYDDDGGRAAAAGRPRAAEQYTICNPLAHFVPAALRVCGWAACDRRTSTAARASRDVQREVTEANLRPASSEMAQRSLSPAHATAADTQQAQCHVSNCKHTVDAAPPDAAWGQFFITLHNIIVRYS
jgi:hypothetical protein